MPDAVIVSACRTAIGTAGKGTLRNTTPFELADTVVAESLKRTGLDPNLFDDVILGESMYGGGDVARHAAITAGMTTVPGLALNRHCASGLAAVSEAAANIRAGMADAIIAGGSHSSSTAPRSRWRDVATGEWAENWVSPSHPDSLEAPNLDMSITVGWNAATTVGVSREEMDAWALHSHEKAVRAIDEGRFLDEIVPVSARGDNGLPVTFEVDEHPRRTTSMAKLAALPVLHPEIPGFSITAGNSSGVNDAAAALVITAAPFAERHGLIPLAVVRSWAVVGIDPAQTGLAPTKAIPKALQRAGLDQADVDLFEINEAFAAMCVATVRRLGIDPAVVNVSGSGCSLGHPIAASGARMVTTLVHELRRRGGGIGVASMCAGGGMGSAVVLEVPAS
ncbi:thiolase family protein [Dactylosporangium sp. NPDC005572]|uniref:thiolase family protein n=1 Tax=Dactylosporangium sp. NPDC005572 TaxID=3156889 RepID=UPI0033AFD00D